MATINGVKINIGEMTSTQSALETDNSTLIGELNKVKSSMDTLKGTEVWSSEGASAIQTKFENLFPKFSEIHKVVEEYTTFLGKTIQSYDSNEIAVTSAAKNVSDWK